MRVADESEAVAVAVHLPLQDVMTWGVVNADTDVVGEPAPATQDLYPVAFIPVWTLRDGTTALGAAGRLKAERSDIEIHLPAAKDELSLSEFIVGGAECRGGNIRLTAQVGSAALDFTYDQKCLD